jgi:TetR/AcrR family transcriptional repressor of nem operon
LTIDTSPYSELNDSDCGVMQYWVNALRMASRARHDEASGHHYATPHETRHEAPHETRHVRTRDLSLTVAGRPRTFDEDTAVDELLLLFWERGYDHVNQQQMSQATGLSTSSLHNTFGTKPQTFERVLRRYRVVSDEQMEPLLHGCSGTDDLLTFIERIGEQLASSLGPAGCLVVTSMTALVGHDSIALRQLVEEHLRTRRQAFHDALQRAQHLGEPVPEPASTAALLLAAILGIFATARATAAGPQAYEQLEALRTLITTWRRESTASIGHPS